MGFNSAFKWLKVKSAAVEESLNSTIRNLTMKTFITVFITKYYYGVGHTARLTNNSKV
jgi:hypothetical protein